MTDVLRDRPSVAVAPRVPEDETSALRAADADRDRTAAWLGGALAVGRLTSTEYAERLDAAYAARTMDELAGLTRDLAKSDAAAGTGSGAADEAGGDGPGAAGRTEIRARFSKVIRAGRWVAGRHTRLTVRFGALIVNLADAVLPGREVTVEVNSFCGKVVLIVPAGAHVIDEGGALFAKRAVYGRDTAPYAEGPVIRLTGDARFSKVVVFRGRLDPLAAVQHHLPPWLQLESPGR